MSTDLPDWIEDPDLQSAVTEAEEFAGTAGWDRPPRLFALVPTQDLLAADPTLQGHLAESGRYTPVAQDELDTDDLQATLAGIEWPESVAGCVLVQEIVVLPPGAVDDPGSLTREEAAARPDRTEARLAVGALRGRPGGACLLRVRPEPGAAQAEPLRGADLAPNVVQALHATLS